MYLSYFYTNQSLSGKGVKKVRSVKNSKFLFGSDLLIFLIFSAVAALLDAGFHTKYVAKYLNKSERWVCKWRQRCDFRQGLADKPRTGRPSKVGGGVKKTIGSIKYKRGCSTRKLSKHLKSSGHNISHVTVYNYMKIVKNQRSFRRARKQLLTVAQRRKRLQFAREHEHLSAQDWENYIFSHVSTKYLFHVPNRQDDTVWGSQSENVPDVSCVKSSAKVMIWGAMGVSGLSNLHIVPTGKTVDSSYYIEHILTKELKPALNRTRTTGKINTRKLVLPGLAVFIQDGGYPTYGGRNTDMVLQQPAKLYRETRMAWRFTRSKLYRESLEYIGL